MSDPTEPDSGESGAYRSSRFERASDGAWTARRQDAVVSAGRFENLGLVEAEFDEQPEPERRPRRRRPRAPRVWLQGGSTTQRWNWLLVGGALMGLGAGLLIATAASAVIGGTLGGWVGSLVLWASMIVPVVFAYSRSVPRGLLRFRATDLLFGLFLGLGLRVVSGLLEQAERGFAFWPALPTTDGGLSGVDWLVDAVVPVVVSPVVEEFFFRGFLLVALFTVFRRLTRSPSVAGAGAALISTGIFVLLHQFTGSLTAGASGAASIALFGLATAVLVLVTGRFWAALIAHVVFNGSYVALAVVGTLAGLNGGIVAA
ncbi:CPBP family intramembrane glutamic endopeptidase [Microbacterium sp. BG28]|uniref:CPBP family intramembrane glutamic endopeptidase n=1 Tax=Microbacterium sp. BG28 TaxID=3097356 RepID=UPI002A59AB83|nr:CPBP family intramembrane glutamic endopeptidase [Microbacterium sp. BG28]MDY0830184.1 CPBP family intramembrane glutamic endopeptidase [Microbacterium sp. BG28]